MDRLFVLFSTIDYEISKAPHLLLIYKCINTFEKSFIRCIRFRKNLRVIASDCLSHHIWPVAVKTNYVGKLRTLLQISIDEKLKQYVSHAHFSVTSCTEMRNFLPVTIFWKTQITHDRKISTKKILSFFLHPITITRWMNR